MSGAALEDATFCWNAKAETTYCSIWGRAWDALSRKTSVSLQFSSGNPGFPWWLVDDGCYLPRTKSFWKETLPKGWGWDGIYQILASCGSVPLSTKWWWCSEALGFLSFWPVTSSLPCIFHTTEVIFPLYETSVHFFLSFMRRRACSFVSLLCIFLSLTFLVTRALL